MKVYQVCHLWLCHDHSKTLAMFWQSQRKLHYPSKSSYNFHNQLTISNRPTISNQPLIASWKQLHHESFPNFHGAFLTSTESFPNFYGGCPNFYGGCPNFYVPTFSWCNVICFMVQLPSWCNDIYMQSPTWFPRVNQPTWPISQSTFMSFHHHHHH